MRLSVCSMEWADNSSYKFSRPTGGIHLNGNSSLQIEGSTYFVKNHADGNGGRRRLERRYITYINAGAVPLLRCLVVARSNTVGVDDGSNTNIAQNRFPLLPGDRVRTCFLATGTEQFTGMKTISGLAI